MTWPLHMQMQTKPSQPQTPPKQYTLVALSLPLAVLASFPATVSASHILPPRGHCAQRGTGPDLLCHTGLAKRSLSLRTPDSLRILLSQCPRPSPPSFSVFILHHSWDQHFKSMPSNQPEKNNATTPTAEEQIKHSHIWMLGYYAITLKAKWSYLETMLHQGTGAGIRCIGQKYEHAV